MNMSRFADGHTIQFSNFGDNLYKGANYDIDLQFAQ